MVNRKDILKDVYKYYPRVTEEDKIREEKDKLRQKKVKNKGGEEQERQLQDITKISEKYAVADWTDSESCCYEYLVLLHKNFPILDDDRILMKVLNGIRYNLRIVVSILELYYFTVVDVTRRNVLRDIQEIKKKG